MKQLTASLFSSVTVSCLNSSSICVKTRVTPLRVGERATFFVHIVGEDHAVAACLPPHLEQSAIKILNDRQDRDSFFWDMNFAAPRVSDNLHESCCLDDHFSNSARLLDTSGVKSRLMS